MTADFIVAPDGSGDFKTVQEAVSAVPSDNSAPKIIFIKPGTYKEKLHITSPEIHLLGQEAEKTILTFDDFARRPNAAGRNMGTSGSASVTIRAAGFNAENITFENSAAPQSAVGQAVAILIYSDRAVFRNCRFLGNQDTLYPNGGREYFYHCFIRGSVDFIFGNAAAVFDQCEIQSDGPGCVTAQSRINDKQTTGYVFTDCKLTAADGIRDGAIYLGRPWRLYSRVIFMHCDLGPQINPRGWSKWNSTDKESDLKAYYAEYTNTGPSAPTDKRATWSHQLTDAEAQQFSKENFLKGDDNWAPWTDNPPATQPAATQP